MSKFPNHLLRLLGPARISLLPMVNGLAGAEDLVVVMTLLYEGGPLSIEAIVHQTSYDQRRVRAVVVKGVSHEWIIGPVKDRYTTTPKGVSDVLDRLYDESYVPLLRSSERLVASARRRASGTAEIKRAPQLFMLPDNWRELAPDGPETKVELYRQITGVGVQVLAARAGIHEKTAERIRTGGRFPTTHELQRLAAAMGMRRFWSHLAEDAPEYEDGDEGEFLVVTDY